MQFNDYRALGFTTLQNGLIAYYPQLQISDAELLLIIQLEAFGQRGELFPSNEKIAANTNLTVTDVGNLIQHLIDQNYLTIEQTTDSQDKIGNQYSLNKLYEALDHYIDQNILIKNKQNKTTRVTDNLENNPINYLSRKVEIEFGRYLSPIEREEISQWLSVDHYSPDIIELALREAVLSQAYSLKYIDRVLLNWQRHNLKTTAEVKRFLKRNR
ncbi:DnaD domain protein [Lactobacillus kefiranofaciens]|uniref:DNA replication protein n=1 Tax=Lactobacillus kefiranofaciens TaxID=267818 RepID=A0AAX3UFG2_9LACO|nr:DnaD domain protein [Lactobacillus kefiranofaciens]AEG40210.1 Initiation of chromosome replication protein [Lactobacillus kefiranofaciens subsp. kefiranofaciens]KRL25542.1 initiation of chromosome replication protein [Lactobacillus kefiranofaciens subsp. kefirgranum DSM 10550 = JCM 8572]KRM23052.1 initiation of chromosome replication protein [Lactobacillus kefiranofaciens subsp. kefiranofaciens DSM 5016 = JCM 6985]MCJ2171390.1 DnaD domain protein [Lactobacillus kefiranofaciens]MCP9330114.1 